MAAAAQTVSAPPSAAAPNPSKRKRPAAKGKGSKNKKKKFSRSDEPLRRRTNKPSAKFLKVLQKRARDYNSDDEDEDEQEGDHRQQKQQEERPPSRPHDDHDRDDDGGLSGDDDDDEEAAASSSGDEEAGGGRVVTRFEEGCRAFRVAFLKIMAKKLPDDPLGPILSANKKLVAAKLAEEVEEQKPKGEARKEKREAAEKGHVLPNDHLDTHGKELMKIATQGVVRLFNAVSKAQKPRKDLNPSSTRDAKVLARERKKTFLEELAVTSHQDKKSKASSSFSKHVGKDEDEPGWAPLRDTYMIGSKLKDWDKMKDTTDVEQTKAPLGVSSDEE